MDSYNGKETFLQADKRSCKSFDKKKAWSFVRAIEDYNIQPDSRK